MLEVYLMRHPELLSKVCFSVQSVWKTVGLIQNAMEWLAVCFSCDCYAL
jgi:hypothetical protein